jgi:hypothetical protein
MLLSFDPGVKNLAVWCGADPEHTTRLGLFDIKSGGKPTYESTIDLLLRYEWMNDPSQIKEAVVETQAVRNIPSRIVATTIYAFLRGRGVKVRFSGSQMKDRAIQTFSARLGVKLLDKPVGKENAGRRYRVNKKNSIAVASALAGEGVLSKFGKKLDDVCDAFLLGVGLFLVSQ